MKKLVSVIVPVYNVEKYIDKCVESLLNQDYKNIEVILVDDGTPDRSGDIIDRLKEEDHRIVVGKNNGFPRIVDMYTYAFLKSIDYTENCYSCRYASQSRVSDISLGDSWGSELSEEEKKKGISLVLCQTKKGEELLKKSNVELFDADITRAIQLNHQLEYPSRIPSSRMFFFENLEKGFDFAMKKILPKEYLKNEIKIILSKVGIRR